LHRKFNTHHYGNVVIGTKMLTGDSTPSVRNMHLARCMRPLKT